MAALASSPIQSATVRRGQVRRPAIRRAAPHVADWSAAKYRREAASCLIQAKEFLARRRNADAFEYAYRAGLRTAGAWVAASPLGTRKRLPPSAWARLRLLGEVGDDWAGRFSGYSARRQGIRAGYSPTPSTTEVEELIECVEAFVSARGENPEDLPQAA